MGKSPCCDCFPITLRLGAECARWKVMGNSPCGVSDPTTPKLQRRMARRASKLKQNKSAAFATLLLSVCFVDRNANYEVIFDYSMISVTTPDPTVLPPSLIAKRSPSSIAIGVISSIVITTLSPGMHISVPSGSERSPVTSVVLK